MIAKYIINCFFYIKKNLSTELQIYIFIYRINEISLVLLHICVENILQIVVDIYKQLFILYIKMSSDVLLNILF